MSTDDVGRRVPVPNVNAPGLARLLQFCKRRVAEAEVDKQRHAAKTLSLYAASQTARRLAAEAGEARAAAAEREQRLAAAAAEAPRLASEAGARLAAAAEVAECLPAEAADAERLAAAAEVALQEHISRSAPEPGAPAALGSTGVIFAEWEQALIAQMDKRALLQLIVVRARKLCAAPLPRPRPWRAESCRPSQAADYLRAECLLDLACFAVADAARGAAPAYPLSHCTPKPAESR